jgi:4-hydroxybenzoate polyprenyltransferase
MDSRRLYLHVNRTPRRYATFGWKGIGVRPPLFLIIALTSVFFFGCDLFYSKESKNTEKNEGIKTMETLATIEEKTAAIPPIDAAAPLHTATATFALG